jgi:hypothetical protein
MLAFLIAAAAVAVGFGLWRAQPTEAQGPPSFSLPPQAAEVAPGVFSLGTAVHNGVLVEGIAVAHHRPGHSGGPGGGGEDPPPAPDGDPAACFSFIFAGGAAWSSAEPYAFNPAGSGIAVTVGDLDASLEAWDTEVGASIFGAGAQTTDRLSADSSAPDGANETYFARIVGPGAGGIIAITIVWREVGGPMIEWDMVFNTKFGWSLSGESGLMDFLNIATHEAGHASGMGHTDDVDFCSEQTMFPTARNGETKKYTLDVGDQAGIAQLYP